MPDNESDPLSHEQTTDGGDVQVADFAGPLPTPSMLRDYEKLVPGAAQRMLALAERNAEHLRKLQDDLVEQQLLAQQAERRQHLLGQLLGFLLALISILTGAFIALRGASLAGGLIGSTGFLAIIIAFLIGRLGQIREEEPRRSEDSPKDAPV
jgi:uncharacterized membrane protein